MITGFNIPTVDDVEIRDKQVLVRVDYNVSLTPENTIADDLRIRQSLPTLKYLLAGNNKIIIISHLGQPKKPDPNLSLEPIVKNLKQHLSGTPVSLLTDFTTEHGMQYLEQQKGGEIIILENIRFFKGEKEGDVNFARDLSKLANVYVNDAFGVSHRPDASVTLIPQFLPSFAGLLLKREVEAIEQVMLNPKKPVVAIVGGAKTLTKMHFLMALLDKIDVLMLGGGVANTFLASTGAHLGTSLFEKELIGEARQISRQAKKKGVTLILPKDAVVHTVDATHDVIVAPVQKIPTDGAIVDIGPQTQAEFGTNIATAKTIIWNGPVGKVEDPRFARGTDFLFYAIAQNSHAYSIVGGGDTIAAISQKEYIDKISWVSTGGGAMLEFIEKGTLPGLEALEKK